MKEYEDRLDPARWKSPVDEFDVCAQSVDIRITAGGRE